LILLIFGTHLTKYIVTTSGIRTMAAAEGDNSCRPTLNLLREHGIDAAKALAYTLIVSLARIAKSITEITHNDSVSEHNADFFNIFVMLGFLYGLSYSVSRNSQSVSCVQIGWAMLGLGIYALMDICGFSSNVWAVTIPLVLFCGRVLATPCKSIRNYNLVAIMVNHCVLVTSSFIYVASASRNNMLEQVFTSLLLFLSLISALLVSSARLSSSNGNGCSLATKAVSGFLVSFLIQRAVSSVATNLILISEKFDDDAVNWIIENMSVVATGVLFSYLLCNMSWSIGSVLSIGTALSIGGVSFLDSNFRSFLPNIFGINMRILLKASGACGSEMISSKSILFSTSSGIAKKAVGACVIVASGVLAALLLNVEIKFILHYIDENSETLVLGLVGVFFFSTVMGLSLFTLVAGCSFILAQIFGFHRSVLCISIVASVGGLAGALVSYSVGKSVRLTSYPVIDANRTICLMSALRLMPVGRHFNSLNHSAGITGVTFSPFVGTLLLSVPRIVCIATVGAYIGHVSNNDDAMNALPVLVAVVTDILSSFVGLFLFSKEIRARGNV